MTHPWAGPAHTEGVLEKAMCSTNTGPVFFLGMHSNTHGMAWHGVPCRQRCARVVAAGSLRGPLVLRVRRHTNMAANPARVSAPRHRGCVRAHHHRFPPAMSRDPGKLRSRSSARTPMTEPGARVRQPQPQPCASTTAGTTYMLGKVDRYLPPSARRPQSAAPTPLGGTRQHGGRNGGQRASRRRAAKEEGGARRGEASMCCAAKEGGRAVWGGAVASRAGDAVLHYPSPN